MYDTMHVVRALIADKPLVIDTHAFNKRLISIATLAVPSRWPQNCLSVSAVSAMASICSNVPGVHVIHGPKCWHD